MNAVRLVLRYWTLFAALAAAGLLAAAHGFERFADLPPCPLCLKQRDVYWAALAVAVPASLWGLLVARGRSTPRLAAYVLFGVFATGAVVAVFHAGGEQGWWALPATCLGATGSIDAAAMSALLAGAATTPPPSCGEVAWSWLGLSMAGWNALAASALAGISLIASMRPPEARAPKETSR